MLAQHRICQMHPDRIGGSVETRHCSRGGKVEWQVADVCGHRLLGFGEGAAIGHADMLGERGQGPPAVPDDTHLPVVTADDLLDAEIGQFLGG